MGARPRAAAEGRMPRAHAPQPAHELRGLRVPQLHAAGGEANGDVLAPARPGDAGDQALGREVAQRVDVRRGRVPQVDGAAQSDGKHVS